MWTDGRTQLEARFAIQEAKEEFKSAPHLAEELRKWLVAVFQKWKIQRGDRKPQMGLLGRTTFKSAKPYQCTKTFTASYADLVLKLREQNYPDMLAVEEKLSLRRILAGAVLVEANDTPISRDGLHRSLEIYRQYRLLETEAMAEIYKEEATTGRGRQRTIARMPRMDALQSLISKIVQDKPSIKVNEMLQELRRSVHRDIVEEIAEGEIYFVDKKGRGGNLAPVSGLKDRISRARRKLLSR